MVKKNFAVLLITFVLMAGCATRQHVALKGDNQQEVYTSNHFGIFPGPDNAISAARAEVAIITAKAQADLTRSLAKQIEQGQTATTVGRYIGVIINDDPRLTAYIPHPEMNQKIKVAPGSYAVVVTNNIAERISIYDSNGDYTVSQTFKKGGVYNGIKYDYGVRIYKVR